LKTKAAAAAKEAAMAKVFKRNDFDFLFPFSVFDFRQKQNDFCLQRAFSFIGFTFRQQKDI